jgi:hypothetical protein
MVSYPGSRALAFRARGVMRLYRSCGGAPTLHHTSTMASRRRSMDAGNREPRLRLCERRDADSLFNLLGRRSAVLVTL